MNGLPKFYDPKKAGDMYRPNEDTIIQAALQAGWEPSSRDEKKGKTVALLMIDPQCDFVFEPTANFPGSLSVPGAVGDMQRIAELIYKYGNQITSIYASLDTHYMFQIFHRMWWKDNATNKPVSPWRLISDDDIKTGKVSPVVDAPWSADYPAKLAASGNKPLMIWPEHCLEISAGSAMVPIVAEAVMYWSAARKSQVNILRKGNEPRTEAYGIWKPEVVVPNSVFPSAHGLNPAMMEIFDKHDEIWVVGEASSHCVLETLEQMFAEFKGSPDALAKVRILTDCTSPVPPVLDDKGNVAVDFPAIAKARFDFFKSNGFHLTTSVDVAV